MGLFVGLNAIFGSNTDPTLSLDTFVTLITSTLIGIILGAVFGASLLTVLINLGNPAPSTRFIRPARWGAFSVTAVVLDEQIEIAKTLMQAANAGKVRAYAAPKVLRYSPPPFKPTRESLQGGAFRLWGERETLTH